MDKWEFPKTFHLVTYTKPYDDTLYRGVIESNNIPEAYFRFEHKYPDWEVQETQIVGTL
jgi:hypothetical protein